MDRTLLKRDKWAELLGQVMGGAIGLGRGALRHDQFRPVGREDHVLRIRKEDRWYGAPTLGLDPFKIHDGHQRPGYGTGFRENRCRKIKGTSSELVAYRVKAA